MKAVYFTTQYITLYILRNIFYYVLIYAYIPFHNNCCTVKPALKGTSI